MPWVWNADDPQPSEEGLSCDFRGACKCVRPRDFLNIFSKEGQRSNLNQRSFSGKWFGSDSSLGPLVQGEGRLATGGLHPYIPKPFSSET